MDLQAILARLAAGETWAQVIASLPADQHQALETALIEFVNADEPLTQERIDAMTRAADGVEAIRTAVAAQAAQQAQVESLRSRVTAPPPAAEPEQPAAPVEVAPVEVEAVAPAAPEQPVEQLAPAAEERELETVAAAATPSVRVVGQPPATMAPQAQATPSADIAFTASADIPGVPAGQTLDMLSAAEAFIERAKRFGRSSGVDRVPVLTASSGYDPAQRLSSGDAQGNSRRIGEMMRRLWNARSVEEIVALTAAGGFCAPIPPDYTFLNLTTTDRPVRAGLMSSPAPRGGIRFQDTVDFTDFAGAISDWSEQDDIDALTDSEVRKPCLRVECPDDTEVMVEAIVRCLTIGNLLQRAFPERVADVLAKVVAMWSRHAERKLLAAIDANSTALTFGQTLGAARDIIFGLAMHREGFIDRQRASSDLPMDVILPRWVQTQMALDLMRQQPGDGTLTQNRARVNAMFADHNLRTIWSIDGSPSGANGQNFSNPLATGAVDAFPNPVRARIFHPGAHVFLDGGELDLGLVRDSTLNAANDFQLFAESFEGLYTPGFEPAYIDFTVCADGSTSAPVDVDACDTDTGS